MSELVKEIDGAIDAMNHLLSEADTAKPEACEVDANVIKNTLQRAREALSWKPIDENTPYDTVLLFMRHDGNVRQDFIYDEGLERVTKSYMGWMHVPEYYIPEES